LLKFIVDAISLPLLYSSLACKKSPILQNSLFLYMIIAFLGLASSTSPIPSLLLTSS
jgi:hypothetical protein